MGEGIKECKAALRVQVRDAVRKLTKAARQELSEKARDVLKGRAIWKNAETILFYAPVKEELDVWPLLAEAQAEGKRIALPRFSPDTNSYLACEVPDPGSDLQSGQFGIREPGASCSKLELKRLDLILVPGIAFDLQGHRLGRGQGFYDRLLGMLHGRTCGVAFDEQIVEQIPVAPHDRYVNCILTPTRWLEF